MQKAIKNILITGANKGLGYGMVEQLCKNSASNNFNILLGARDQKKGQQAIEQLKSKYPSANVQFQKVELGNTQSYGELINELQSNNVKLDILVNNAGVNTGEFMKQSTAQQAQEMFNINYKSTAELTKQLLPQIEDHAKIIFVGSSLGSLSMQGPVVQKALNDSQLTEEKLEEIATGFIKQTNKENTQYDWALEGFIPGYSASKAIMQAWVRFLLQKHLTPNQTVHIVSPGWCKTDMGSDQAPQTVEEGIQYMLEVINDQNFVKNNEKHLKFFEHGKQLDF